MMIGVSSTCVGGAVCLPSWVLYSTILTCSQSHLLAVPLARSPTCSQSHLLESLTCFSGEKFHLRGGLRLTAGFREKACDGRLGCRCPRPRLFSFRKSDTASVIALTPPVESWPPLPCFPGQGGDCQNSLDFADHRGLDKPAELEL
jgi:hypothetical protein